MTKIRRPAAAPASTAGTQPAPGATSRPVTRHASRPTSPPASKTPSKTPSKTSSKTALETSTKTALKTTSQPASPPTSRPKSPPTPQPKSRAGAKAAAKPYHHGSLRESLLQAAETLLAERGAQGLSLRDVAKLAGVSHAAPYHHFASLDELLADVAQRGFVLLGDAMAAAAGGSDVRENLLAICEAYVGFAVQQPAQFRLMFGPLLGHKQEHPALRDSAERSFSVLMQAAQAYDAEQGPLLGLSGWSLAHGLANLAIDGAFETLPLPGPHAPPQALARLMAERLLPPASPRSGSGSAPAWKAKAISRKPSTRSKA